MGVAPCYQCEVQNRTSARQAILGGVAKVSSWLKLIIRGDRVAIRMCWFAFLKQLVGGGGVYSGLESTCNPALYDVIGSFKGILLKQSEFAVRESEVAVKQSEFAVKQSEFAVKEVEFAVTLLGHRRYGTNVGRKMLSVCLKHDAAFSCCSEDLKYQKTSCI